MHVQVKLPGVLVQNEFVGQLLIHSFSSLTLLGSSCLEFEEDVDVGSTGGGMDWCP